MLKPTLLTLSIASLAASTAFAVDNAAERMKTTTVTTEWNGLAEERPIGVTGRPEWTGARRFPTTRVYIQKEPFEVGVEQWWRYRYKRDNSSISRLSTEIEIGLPYRMQLDFYYDMAVDGDSRSRTEDFAAEIRYAFADWGKIWANPTVYFEYKWVDEGADVIEAKLLLGDQFGTGWHWGVNFVYEKQIGDDRETECMVTGGISKTLLDGRLGFGAEFKYDYATVHGERSNPEHIILVGPSLQWRITEQLHLDLTALFGTNDDSPRNECYVVLGYDFGKESNKYLGHDGKDGKGYTPVDNKYRPVAGRR